MPVNVPEEPKRYTTVYDNFKGVDFTNDASNVYKRRSPTGLNMLPDLDGRPYKRPGWEIAFDVQDFATAAEIVGVTEITPKRTHYFSYDGHDFIMIFNSLGVFWIYDDDPTLRLAQLYSEGAMGEFPPSVTIGGEQVKLEADANRAFFFEGGGTSGFYVFVNNDLYRFGENENGEYCFMAVEPYIPTIITGATPSNHVGTTLDSLNMLTDKRTIEYFGDESADYLLTSLVDSADDVSVQILNSQSGDWEDIPRDSEDHPWSLVDNSKVRFASGKEPPTSNIGNVRITFKPQTGTSVTILNAQTPQKTVSCQEIAHRSRLRDMTVTEKYDRKKKTWVRTKTSYGNPSSWMNMTDSLGLNDTVFNDIDVYKLSDFEVMSDHTGSFAPTSLFTQKWGAYNKTVTLTPKSSIYSEADSSKKTVKTEDGSWKTFAVSGGLSSVFDGGTTRTRIFKQIQLRTITTTLKFQIYATYTKAKVSYADASVQNSREAFSDCKKVLAFGNNIYNQVFVTANNVKDFKNRVWYSAANNPAYFPDLNYMEVGADDKEVMGLEKVGSYLGIVKKGSGVGASVYLAYSTSFDEQTTYAVKQSVSGVGAISNGAFNVLNEEPLFLSEKGVVGIDISETDINKQIRNRSFFINKRLLRESNLENAVSFVHKGLYYLAINNHCYVLDGSQKSSWANEKTNLQYECYYLDNIPAQCFAKMGETLYFTDFAGRLCRFRDKGGVEYADAYSDRAQWVSAVPIIDNEVDILNLSGATGESAYLVDENSNKLTDESENRLTVMAGLASDGETVRYLGEYYTILEVDENGIATLGNGVPIAAEWSTIADDDEAVHFYKNLTKKGFVISLLPEHGAEVDVILKPDERGEVEIGTLPAGDSVLPWDIIVRKKVKKYKRLQIICRNNRYDDGFSLDQIIKTYTMGNYSKNRR